MGTLASTPASTTSAAVPDGTASSCSSRVNSAGKRICCVCQETKSARDECILLNGEERCRNFIEAHNQCLRSEGFDVQ
ncbi:Cytochrome c oxidase copper chaperone, related [Neospora caninum Liverpool]|uniref:Cytochrome c oxidase copper chaperone, related n=1 Tax=Neospora caninum (strain Liverpool) TaxID=572307 RepID=F0VDU0_NEOCL|nr:Cytochrome c oxidase copper chaperone, related [Neospora caninum Liverpool]CBZ51883.1 Cytochrome c oxidase copper chaperone, related [Neospora caninum Liverpool]CEL65843.1 TPA: Cytochrome c oxidase copper chaperone, related [Neospora caninum Liverpool]|eukprot:XP_003881916.1 Cytochrome c oxidase copper chaperone, related [Neospora caninum Liverpool]